MRKLIVTFIFLVIIHHIAAAQDKTITLRGDAELSETANQVVFSFYVKQDGKSLSAAYSEAQSYVQLIYSKLFVLGLDSTSIQQSRVRMDEKNISLFTSKKYEALIRTKVIVNDLQILEKVLEVLSQFKLDYISELTFRLKDDRNLQERTYIAAIQNAKLNAAAITSSQDLTLGEIISISEETEYSIVSSEERYYSKYASYSNKEMFPEQIITRKKLKVTFKIK